MKLAIMQPYFFPYIGYFQLVNAVDKFVIHDDVQWIKGGWINRNRILMQGKPEHITLPLRKDSSLLQINQRNLAPDVEQEKQKILRRIESAYRSAPHFDQAFAIVSNCLDFKEENVSLLVINSLRKCCEYLNISTPFVISSELNKNNELSAEERVLDINKVMKAKHYINPIGGTELYDRETFSKHGLNLSYIKTGDISYKQFNEDHVPFLSIIDVMMFNAPREINKMLDQYRLL